MTTKLKPKRRLPPGRSFYQPRRKELETQGELPKDLMPDELRAASTCRRCP